METAMIVWMVMVAIIAFLSGNILDYTTCNRSCALCDKGRKKEDDNCRLNFQSSAEAMEADDGAELVNNSKILKEVR